MNMTPDRVPSADWDLIHELAVEIANADKEEEEARYRARLLEYLEVLERKYGAIPSILATRADYVDDINTRRNLLQQAFRAARDRSDHHNELLIASSLSQLEIEISKDIVEGEKWLKAFEEALGGHEDEFEKWEFKRLTSLLEAIREDSKQG